MNRNKMKVSLLVFSYNQFKYIEDAIHSALNQDYCNLEIIISDDCSNDGTFDLVKNLVSNYYD